MRRISVLLGLLLSFWLPLRAQTGEHAHAPSAAGSGNPAAPAGPEPQDTLGARVDALFRQWDRPGSPGAAVAVIRDGEIVYSRGYGMANLEYDVPITPATIFHIASISKHFTAFAITLLAEEGKLSLDDDVRTHLPEVPDFGKAITIRQLIHHTSGLRDQWELLAMAGWRLDDVITREHILKMVSHQRALNFEPGEEYLYSNTGYTLLAVIVERVSGQSFREFTEERIFRPLGMTSTHFHDDHEMIVPGRAYSYAPRQGGGFRNSPLNYANVGATSLFTTVEDMAKWDRNFHEPQVGSAALLEQMQTRGVLNDGKEIEYAFALSIGEHRGLRTVGHSGADAGYRSYYVRFPDQRLSVVVLSNLSSFNPTHVALRVADIYLAGQFPGRRRSQAYVVPETDALRGHGAQRQPGERGSTSSMPTRPVRLSAQQLREKVGLYASPATDEFRRIELRGGKLMLMIRPNYELAPLSSTHFLVRESPNRVEMEFEPTDSGAGAPFRLLETVEGGEPVIYEPTVSLTPAQLADYTGTYYSEELGTTYEFVLREGRLVAQHRRHEDTRLSPTLRDRFLGDNWWLRRVEFTRDEQNRVTGFSLTGGRVRNLRFEKQTH
ncbi:hypothetical protein BH20GEM2_BH20GEM2_08580 [soil metagenome]